MCAYVHLSFGVCALCLCSQNNNRDILSSIYFRLDYRMPDQVRPTMSAGQFLTDLNRFPVVNPYSERPVFAVRSFTFFRRLAAASFCFNDIGPFSGALVTCRQNFIIPSDFSLLYCMSPFCISEPVFVSQKNTNLVKIIQKDERIIAAVQFEIKLFDFFYRSKRLTDYIYTDIYCKLLKCIGQTPCSYEHYLVYLNFCYYR